MNEQLNLIIYNTNKLTINALFKKNCFDTIE